MNSWRGVMGGCLLGLSACSTTAVFEDDETGGMSSGGAGSGGQASGGDSADTGGSSTDTGGESSDTGGSSTDTGGSSTDTGGESSGGADPSGGAGGGDATGGVVTGGAGSFGLHGDVTDNGDGTVTIFYDFEEPDQLADWTLSPLESGAVSIDGGRLVVDWASGVDSTVAAARFVRRMRVDELSFESEVLSGGGNHINVWIQAQGISDWRVSAGYDFVLNAAGRLIVADGSDLLTTTDETPVVPDAVYVQQFLFDSDSITWLLDDEVVLYDDEPINRATTRDLGLGAYQSTAVFDDVTITGVLD